MLLPALRRHTPALLLLVALSAVPAKSLALSTTKMPEVSQPGCTLTGEVYHCDLHGLQQALRKSQTVAIETQAMDRQTAAQLRHLVNELGKQPATANRPADLIFLLTPIATPGVNYGPSDRDLATLRIYTGDAQGGRGTLVWAETLRGQGDRPWPAQVNGLIEQFQGRLSGQ